MNQLEEQLDYLNFLCEGVLARPRLNIVIGGTPEKGYGICSCSTERFINISSHTQIETRAALLSTWMVGYAASKVRGGYSLEEKYKFVEIVMHGGGFDLMCPSYIFASHHRGERLYIDYGLIGDYFEEAILVAKDEFPEFVHNNLYWQFADCIKRMNNETAEQCLSAKLEYVFREEINERKPRWVRSRG